MLSGPDYVIESRGTRVKAVLERLADTRGLPRSITVDHGPEFEGQLLDAWAYQANVQMSPGQAYYLRTCCSTCTFAGK